MHSHSAGVRHVVLRGAAACYSAFTHTAPSLGDLTFVLSCFVISFLSNKNSVGRKTNGLVFADGSVTKHTGARSWVGIN